ncbi:MAG: HEPN domain-containing protein [Hungatella hathewayi]|nr:HEPN domain-containing protein [Hungatella hathewayi]
MDGSMIDLSKYRFSKAMELITASQIMLENHLYKSALNRSYYAIFEGMRAITALDKFDSSKHSGVIAYFNQHYVKTGIFDKKVSAIIKGASMLREKSDYQDFYVASEKDAKEQLELAKEFLEIVRDYLKKKDIL